MLDVVFLVLIALVVMLAVYLFAYMARFENSLGQSFKNAALIAVANLPWSLLLLVLLAASAFGLWMLPWLMILLPAVYILERRARKRAQKYGAAVRSRTVRREPDVPVRVVSVRLSGSAAASYLHRSPEIMRRR